MVCETTVKQFLIQSYFQEIKGEMDGVRGLMRDCLSNVVQLGYEITCDATDGVVVENDIEVKCCQEDLCNGAGHVAAYGFLAVLAAIMSVLSYV